MKGYVGVSYGSISGNPEVLGMPGEDIDVNLLHSEHLWYELEVIKC